MKNRRRLLLFAAAAALLFALALSGAHWRLYGWCRGEPFYRGRPASYWRGEAAACEAVVIPGEPVELLPPPGPFFRLRLRLAQCLNRPDLTPEPDCSLVNCDGSAVPVLIALLGDSDPKVRYLAAQRLGLLNGDGRAALPALRELSSDRAAVPGGATVGDAAAWAVCRIEAFLIGVEPRDP
jgi:hypothetical protein